MGRSGDLVNQARIHVRSARALAALDSTLALAACHDAIRKALDAHAGASGCCFESSPGAHRAAIAYGRKVLGHLIDAGDLDDAERLRSRRHNAEYEEVPAAQIHDRGRALRVGGRANRPRCGCCERPGRQELVASINRADPAEVVRNLDHTTNTEGRAPTSIGLDYFSTCSWGRSSSVRRNQGTDSGPPSFDVGLIGEDSRWPSW